MRNMKINVSDATPRQLNWLVAKCLGLLGPDGRLTDEYCDSLHHNQDGGFVEDWAQGGPIIERERISVLDLKDKWGAGCNSMGGVNAYGPTPLIAAMRCYVFSMLGEIVEIPEELCK